MSDFKDDLKHVFKYLFLLLCCSLGLVLIVYLVIAFTHWLAR